MDPTHIDCHNIGENVERLIVSEVTFLPDELTSIRKHCSNLAYIDISAGFPPSITDFTVSYGNQLNYAHVYSMNPSELSRIVESCENARFRAHIYSNNLLLSTSRIMRPRRENIEFDNNDDEIDED